VAGLNYNLIEAAAANSPSNVTLPRRHTCTGTEKHPDP
jgi:hypothetical protein